MKKYFVIVMLLSGFVMNLSAQISALDFRNQILAYVKAEGYQPYIDESDESVTFKKEGTMYWITVVDDTAPYYVRFYRSAVNCGPTTDRIFITEAADKTMKQTRCVKLACMNQRVNLCIEAHMTKIEEFTNVFEIDMDILERADERLKEHYGVYSDNGFVMSRMFVANTDKDGGIISGYGERIEAAKSKYIKPRVTIYSDRDQTCTFQVKFNTPDGLSSISSSPSGYTYETTVHLRKGVESYDLSGWGTDYSGCWSAGSYSFEIFYKEKLQVDSYFTIY